jgi:ATP-dependent protease Clp ATPase subunit
MCLEIKEDALFAIMEGVFTDIMYDAPSDDSVGD